MLRGRLGNAFALALILLSALVIRRLRPPLAESAHRVKLDMDIYTLPPPSALTALSLGYRSALADYLFSYAKVNYGISGEERRRWDAVGSYLDAIVALDERVRDAYRYCDTMLLYHPVGEPTPEILRHVRVLQEKGVKAFPGDAELWTSHGQFLAFVAQQWLVDDAEKADFKAAGAKALARAGELDNGNGFAGWKALAGVGVFTRRGEIESALSALERIYAVTDDESLRDTIRQRAAALQAEVGQARGLRLKDEFGRAWRADLPFVSRTRMLVLGPRWDVGACAGRAALPGPDGSPPEQTCAESWRDWSAATVE